jgi:diguanylate cyclase (GGDEF)-like protein/PAS domain S-box-containing protein
MENFEKDFKKYILNGLILFIFIISVVYIAIEFNTIKLLSNKISERIENLHNRNIESNIRNYFKIIVDEINFRNRNIEATTKRMIKEDVEKAVNLANNIYKKFKNKLPKKIIETIIIEALSNLKSGNKYIFGGDFQGINKINPVIPIGVLVYNWQDAKGKFMVKEMIKIAQTKGEGFLEYYWFKPDNPDKYIKKVSYVKLFKPFNWYIGEGFYYDDTKEKLKQEILSFTKRLKVLNTKEFRYFIFDTKNFNFPIGTNNDLIKNKIVKHLNKISEQENKIVKFQMGSKDKMLFLKYYKNWRWIIGAEVNYNNFKNEIEREKKFLKKQYIKNIVIYILLVLFITIILIFWAILFSNKTIKKLVTYRKLLEQKELYEKKLINTIPIPLFVKNTDGEFIDCNSEFEKFFGLKRNELIGLKPDKIPFELDMLDKMIIADVFLGKISVPSETEIKNHKGEFRNIVLYKSVFRNTKDEVIGIIAVLLDVTERKKLESKLKKLSFKDELTGVFNRRYFNELIKKQLYTCIRYRSNFSLIMFDIDHFKDINDTFGHPTGDVILKELANLIVSIIRDSDVLCRVGGEEFIVIADYTNLKEAEELAEKIRKKVEGTNFPYVRKVTVSLGVTEAKTDDSVETLLERVDKALYNAKEKGRNRVEIL